MEDAHPLAAVQVLDRSDQAPGQRRRQQRRRLVQDQEPRAHGERPGYRDPLLLARREVLDGRLGDGLQAERFEGEEDPLLYVLAREAEVLGAEGHVVGYPRHDDLVVRVLEDDGHLLADRPAVGLIDRDAVDPDLALGRVLDRRQELDERALARAVVADDRDALPRLDGEVQAPQRRHRIALARPVGEGDAYELDHRAARPSLSSGAPGLSPPPAPSSARCERASRPSPPRP